MNLKQAILSNKGMHQDLSISKDTQEYAYKNVNIRIQATGDGTLASVTNIKSPLKVSDTVMKGRVLNSIMCGEYIVVFTHMDVPDVSTPNVKDYIYRIDLDNIGNTPDNSINVLYAGDLNFSYDKPIDSTFYYENDNIQKVYWVDGWTSDGNNNYPRVINIISDGERNGGDFTTYNADTNFDFYPEIKYVPTINVVKNFRIPSELPAGVIQYFVSFFNKNQSETLIAAGTSLYSIDLKSRGAKADETGCAFDVTVQIENESTVQDEWASSYGYIRLYSVRRTSINGDATVSIVKDFKIEENVTSYSVLDNGIGQETIDPGQIFFVGGTPLFAKTLCQKDNTLFVGGIKTEAITLDKDTKDAIEALIKVTKDEEDRVVFEEAVILTEGYKKLPVSGDAFNSYYPYKLQKDSESLLRKTFKVGEIYRFGVQFQNKQGQWSEVVWIGDKKIANVPTYDSVDSTFDVSNIKLVAVDIPGEYASIRTALRNLFTDLKKNKGFVNYRLLIANPEINGRSIIAQGVVSPTLFSPSLRTKNKPHTINSWIMRPRGGVAPYHHLEPLNPANCEASELSTYDPNETINENSTYSFHNMPFEFIPIDSNEYPKESVDNNFYIDESILTMYSPELTLDTVITNVQNFRIVGIAPLKTNYSDAEVEVENIGIDLDYVPGIDLDIFDLYRINDVSTSVISPLYSSYMYIAPSWGAAPVYPNQCHTLFIGSDVLYKAKYNIHMWQHSKSILGYNINDDSVRTPDGTYITLTVEPLILKTNRFYNHLFSKSSEYFPSYNIKEYYLNLGIGMYKDGGDILFKEGSGYSDLYSGNFDFLHTNEKTNIYRKDLYRSEGSQREQITYRDKEVSASSRIIFNSTPHAIFSLGKSENKLNILPRLNNETLYNGIFTGKYNVLFRDNDPDLNATTIDNEWKDLNTSGGNITDQDIYLKNYFDKKLNAVGCKLGASWVDNFALYREGTKADVCTINYNSDTDTYTYTYKTCCAVNTNTSLHDLKSTLLKNYNYKEIINGAERYVLIRLTNDGLTKCDWAINDTIISNVHSVPLTDDEKNVLYPILEGGDISGGGHVDVTWETPEDTGKYPFLSCRPRDTGRILLDSFTAFDGKFVFTQDVINSNSPNKPYLFIGELYYDIPYSALYGGYLKEDISKLNWIPISKPAPLMTGDGHLYTDTYGNTSEVWGDVGSTTVTEGDTYYQRWDCLKTYPKSVNDMNQVTDITSFMVETHINLDDRADVNRANFNTLVTPTTFNLFNTVYNQKNNLFSYTTLSELLSNENSHQVSWSLAKNIAGDVDTWTNITSASVVNLKHPITKLVNFNNKVVGLTEHSVEVINFNAKNLVPTDNNTFIELKNSAKVDGTIDFTVDKGSRNKSVLVTEAGLYFIDDNENSLIRLSYNGEIQNFGVGRLDSWFKQNIVHGTYTINNPNALHLEYDAKYKDVYICNDTSVLVYNESLNEFTSFVDYQELVSLFTNKGKTYAISHTGLDSHLYSLYDGNNYGVGFYNKELPYSIHYRVNPGPYTDKVFTNVEFTADLSTTQENTHTSNSKPFDYIQAWTEYQDTGRQPLTYDRLSTLREKFRTWRAFIPRNNGTRDRIRNPWVHLKLDKSTNSEHEKLEFHNITITYME